MTSINSAYVSRAVEIMIVFFGSAQHLVSLFLIFVNEGAIRLSARLRLGEGPGYSRSNYLSVLALTGLLSRILFYAVLELQ
jgi:hypothetical protein